MATPTPTPSASAAAPEAPAAGTPQKPYRFDSNHHAKGILGKVRLELGTRTFKASHDGKFNFMVWLFAPGVEPSPDASMTWLFSEYGRGSWTTTMQVFQAGDYTLELRAVDGPWTLTIE